MSEKMVNEPQDLKKVMPAHFGRKFSHLYIPLAKHFF